MLLCWRCSRKDKTMSPSSSAKYIWMASSSTYLSLLYQVAWKIGINRPCHFCVILTNKWETVANTSPLGGVNEGICFGRSVPETRSVSAPWPGAVKLFVVAKHPTNTLHVVVFFNSAPSVLSSSIIIILYGVGFTPYFHFLRTMVS